MIVAVGSKNPVKVEGVRRAFEKFFENVEAIGVEVSSGVRNQPFGHETIEGAINRAKNAFRDGFDFSVGVEAGLFEFSHTITGFIDFQVACVYDGSRYTLGFGPGFEYPPKVIDGVLSGGEVGKVMTDLTGIDDLGKKFGAIGFLTKKHVVRRDLTEIAVTMALIPWVNKKLYGIEP